MSTTNLKTVPETIDGIEFTTTQLDAFRSLELMGELAQSVGPAIGLLSSAEPDAGMDQLAPMLGAALRDVKPSELGPLALKILCNTVATIQDGKTLRRVEINSKDTFNRVFSGRLPTMFKVLVHALRVNYADFGLGSASPESAP